jgi:hypothetical protein
MSGLVNHSVIRKCNQGKKEKGRSERKTNGVNKESPVHSVDES